MGMTVTGVRELAAALGGIDADMRKAMKPGVLKAAEVVADEIRERASFSPEIAGSVKTSARFSASGGGATVTVPERGYPHAGEVAAYDGNGLTSERLRHPVYGNREVWSDKNTATHPMSTVSVVEKEPEAVAIIAETVSAVIAANGL